LANALDHRPALDDDQSEISLDEDLYVSQSSRKIFDKSTTSSRAGMQRETFASPVSGESSEDFEPSTTEESDDSEDDGGLIQRSRPTKPGELYFLSYGFFLLTIG
jgi:hypothetical protein